MLFGHKMPRGYGNGVPYLTPWGGYTDGIGREHWHLDAQCERCGRDFPVGKFHGPLATR
jgi:hypothetical protein